MGDFRHLCCISPPIFLYCGTVHLDSEPVVLEHDEILEQVEWLLSEGEPEKATQLCRRGLRRYPRDHVLWFLLGDSLLDTGQLNQADKAFKNAHEIRANWALPLAKRAEAMAMDGRLSFARSLADKAYEMDRNCPHSSYVLGLLLDLEGRYDEARFFFYRATRLDREGYFVPTSVPLATFETMVKEVLDHFRETSLEDPRLMDIDWEVCPVVDTRRKELAEVSPVTTCIIVETPAPVGSRAGTETALKGFMFWNNNVRLCRDVSELREQIFLSLSDELQDILQLPAEEDEISF